MGSLSIFTFFSCLLQQLWMCPLYIGVCAFSHRTTYVGNNFLSHLTCVGFFLCHPHSHWNETNYRIKSSKIIRLRSKKWKKNEIFICALVYGLRAREDVKVVLKGYQIWRASASAHVLCPFPEYCPVFQKCTCIVSEDLDGYSSISEGLDDNHMISKDKD
jgi:hypothetical protein